jgi:hypothetical protein
MSTSTTLQIPLTVPTSLLQSDKYEVQFSVHSNNLDQDIFIDKRYRASDLTRSVRDGSMSVSLRRTELPRWKEGGDDAELVAHFWKGEKWVAREVCRRI